MFITFWSLSIAINIPNTDILSGSRSQAAHLPKIASLSHHAHFCSSDHTKMAEFIVNTKYFPLSNRDSFLTLEVTALQSAKCRSHWVFKYTASGNGGVERKLIKWLCLQPSRQLNPTQALPHFPPLITRRSEVRNLAAWNKDSSIKQSCRYKQSKVWNSFISSHW